MNIRDRYFHQLQEDYSNSYWDNFITLVSNFWFLSYLTIQLWFPLFFHSFSLFKSGNRFLEYFWVWEAQGLICLFSQLSEIRFRSRIFWDKKMITFYHLLSQIKHWWSRLECFLASFLKKTCFYLLNEFLVFFFASKHLK